MFSSTLVLFALSLLAFAKPVEKRAISATLLSDLTLYTKYASGAYQTTCAQPLGNVLVEKVSIILLSATGFIARDDTRKEIIVSFRGSFSTSDFGTDAEIILIPFSSPGVSASKSVLAHTGFLTAYNSVASNIISTVKAQLAAHPGYTLVSTGHSLGGALASLGGLSLKSNFPGSSVRMFTFGQPRTGNAAYASLVESIVGTSNIFRGTYGVPTLIPQAIGYRHHAVEFWNFADPPTAANVKQCAGEEDPTCSDSIPSGGINAAHHTYFGQGMSAHYNVNEPHY
ncbi:alpha/beta-hydrolase [Rickenella mellea]|uniref:Alpha/beta-hydrolase n=1 Tax=Rickenella mellea TaxID=50990 RepID=A0A4Y7PXP1_9AGAM|nr:alpha/beta-hydrolase [Rickenella mellea]